MGSAGYRSGPLEKSVLCPRGSCWDHEAATANPTLHASKQNKKGAQKDHSGLKLSRVHPMCQSGLPPTYTAGAVCMLTNASIAYSPGKDWCSFCFALRSFSILVSKSGTILRLGGSVQTFLYQPHGKHNSLHSWPQDKALTSLTLDSRDHHSEAPVNIPVVAEGGSDRCGHHRLWVFSF